jgi:hypothetical protein
MKMDEKSRWMGSRDLRPSYRLKDQPHRCEQLLWSAERKVG